MIVVCLVCSAASLTEVSISLTAYEGANVNVYVALGGSNVAGSSYYQYFARTWFGHDEVAI